MDQVLSALSFSLRITPLIIVALVFVKWALVKYEEEREKHWPPGALFNTILLASYILAILHLVLSSIYAEPPMGAVLTMGVLGGHRLIRKLLQ